MPSGYKPAQINPFGHVYIWNNEYVLCIRADLNSFDGVVMTGTGAPTKVCNIPVSVCKHVGRIIYSPPPTQPVEDIAEIVNVGLRQTGDNASLRVISKIIRIYEACKDNPNYSVKELVKDIKD